MLKEYIKNILYSHLRFEPTEGQKNLVDCLAEMTASPSGIRLMIVKGYAGTGKTSVMAAFVKTLNGLGMKPTLLAPTGRAAKVLSAYSKEQAFTVHKKIYRRKSSTDPFGAFVLNFNTHSDMFFIVDEASMIAHDIAGTSIFGTGNLLDDLLKFVYGGQNCRLVLVGDTAQLPPVGRDESPAFDRPRLEVHVQETAECELTEVVRQSHESGILHNATVVRRLIAEKRQELPRLETDMFADVKRISGEDLIETIADAYDKYGIDETAIVCRSNRLANRYNQGIRSRILYREEELVPGDFLMAVRNNYYWINDAENVNFIANGDIVRIIRIRRHIERYGFRFVEADLCLPDYNDLEFTAMVMLDALYSETASIDDEQSRQLYRSVAEDYAHVKPKAMQYKKIGENQFLNALQVKFAYAVTCHKAQGGQWQCVFIDQGRFAAETPDVGYLRWLYTAITRTAEKLYLVNFPEKFFEK